MFRASLCPSSGALDRILLHMVPCALCAQGLLPYFPRHQSAHEVLKTVRSSVQPCTPEDGHNGARNMLSYWFINKS